MPYKKPFQNAYLESTLVTGICTRYISPAAATPTPSHKLRELVRSCGSTLREAFGDPNSTSDPPRLPDGLDIIDFA